VGESGGAIARSASGAWELEPVTGGGGADLDAIWGSSSEDIWVTSDISIVFGHFVNGAWTTHATNGVFAESLWGSSANDIWGVGNRNVVRFDGERWTAEELLSDPFGFYALHGCSANDIWAVGNVGIVYHYDGQSWSALDSGTSLRLRAVRCSSGGVSVVGDSGIILWKNAADG
jgi:hypothetical protein